MTRRPSLEELKRERADLARELAQFDADKASGAKNPKGFLAEYYRQQVAELDDAICNAEGGSWGDLGHSLGCDGAARTRPISQDGVRRDQKTIVAPVPKSRQGRLPDAAS